MNFETFLTSEDGFALPASPAQRAVARVIEGLSLGELAADPNVVELVGGEEAIVSLATLPGTPPTIVNLFAAVRTAKSITSAARGLHVAMTADISKLRAGEPPRVVIVSLTLDHARATFNHLVGTMRARPALRNLIVGKPTANSVMIRQPKTGRLVEMCVVALAEAGAAVVSRWILTLIVDEYPRMPFEGVVKVQETIAAALGRLLDGGQIIGIGSPHAPAGPAYDSFVQGFGKPSADLVVLRGTGPILNPSYWTPERCERLKRTNANAYRTDVLGEFVDSDVSFLDPVLLTRASKRLDLTLPTPKWRTFAATDPATRGNGWTFCVGWIGLNANGSRCLYIGHTHQWIGTTEAPLSPTAVFREMAAMCRRYGVQSVMSDQWSFDANADIARRQGIRLVQETSDDRAEKYQRVEKYLREEALSLPPDPVVARDLQALRLKATTTGFRVDLPITPDGRHCDFAPPIALVALQADRALTYRPVYRDFTYLPEA